MGDNFTWLISSYNPWDREPRESLRESLTSKERRKCSEQSPGVGNLGKAEEDSEMGKNNLFVWKNFNNSLLCCSRQYVWNTGLRIELNEGSENQLATEEVRDQQNPITCKDVGGAHKWGPISIQAPETVK